MVPTETGMFGAKRQIGHSETVERTISFKGVLQHNRNTKSAAQIVAAALGLHRVNYDFAVPVATVVEPDIQGMGLDYETQQNLASFTDLDQGNIAVGGTIA